jgi:adenine phosphoribosyltransferase
MQAPALKSIVTDCYDFPKPGIVFKDITPLLQHPELCAEIVTYMRFQLKGIQIDAIAGIESRGFLFGMLLAHALQIPFIPIRKAGKLPGKTISQCYDLEYGSATIEVQEHAIQKNWNVLIHDDLLATGGTAMATADLILKSGAKVAAFNFLINLTFLNLDEPLKKYTDHVFAVAEY